MTEEAFLEELTLAEGELIDDYVGDRLDAAERAAFEGHFLSTEERRRQLRFTRALGHYASAAVLRRPAPTPVPTAGERLRAFWGGLSWGGRGGLALACVAVIVAAILIGRTVAPTPHRTFAVFTLAAGSGDRGAEGADTQSVRLPLRADALKLMLKLPAGAAPAAAYRAELVTGKGTPEPVEVAGRDERTVSVVIPEERLARGRYAIRLYAVGADNTERQAGDSYLFKVE
jgi:hypothetical protein